MAHPPIGRGTLESKKEFAIRSEIAMVNNFTWQCCLNCDHWTKTSRARVLDETRYEGYRLEETGPMCMKYNVLPPPDVIVTGCRDHEDMIPF